ncbi:WhiB family transcription factor [Mycobacterium phage OhShagHennessy]|uniref:WhiB family transcription factor n=1 Tax=Mycobacterium phage OhShagHennessy TaxID=2801895 RepID=A0A7U0J6Y4_9CAUD|nr:transcriptional regulator WhiB-like [Mycobacterium phage OhShagHennessy]QQV92770.1 WhiB family transcription factor [Mycobacterium phage OhShagHennessy]
MEGKPSHWTEEAECIGDDRFTGRVEDLSWRDHAEMKLTCEKCPVFNDCAEWAEREQVIEVFAAGYWRLPRDNSA